jgi:predicted transcriptional regulator
MALNEPLCYNGFILTKGENMDYDDILQDAFENYDDEHRFDEEDQLEYLEDTEE